MDEKKKDEKVGGVQTPSGQGGTNVQGTNVQVQGQQNTIEKYLQEQLQELHRQIEIIQSLQGKDIVKELNTRTESVVNALKELSVLIEKASIVKIDVSEYRNRVADAVKPILPQSVTQNTTTRKRGGNFEDRVKQILSGCPDRKMKETELKAKLMEEYSINTVGSRVGQMVSNSQLVREGEYIRLP